MSSLQPIVIACPVIILTGPTAVGKTDLSLRVADQFNCEIISVDSMQVYRFMDIGTAKPTLEERAGIIHHLIDVADPADNYDAARFVVDCLKAIELIAERGKIPLLTGGTGFYFKALLEGLFDCLPADKQLREQLKLQLQERGRDALFAELRQKDPATAERLHINDTQRLVRALEIHALTNIPWSVHIQKQKNQEPPITFSKLLRIGLDRERQELYERIALRADLMMEQGLVREVERLLNMGFAPSLNSMQSIGYRHVNNFLAGTWDMDTMLSNLIRDTRHYAKRQLTWFRASSFQWFHPESRTEIVRLISAWMQNENGARGSKTHRK